MTRHCRDSWQPVIASDQSSHTMARSRHAASLYRLVLASACWCSELAYETSGRSSGNPIPSRPRLAFTPDRRGVFIFFCSLCKQAPCIRYKTGKCMRRANTRRLAVRQQQTQLHIVEVVMAISLSLGTARSSTCVCMLISNLLRQWPSTGCHD